MKPQTLPILVFTFLTILFPFSKPDLASDRSALLALRSAVGGRTLLWNITETSPCLWAGVLCEQNRVTVLRLPGVALSGQLPNGIFGNLTRLRTLSLRLNALTGSLPSDLAAVVNLRNLYLQGNLFTGDIPEFLFTLHDLVRLNLASNNFSGEISSGFNNLTRLKTLFLEGNSLTGSIPPGFDVPSLEQFNVSNNALNGSVPSKLQTFSKDSFLGNSLCGGPLDSCPGNATIPGASGGGGGGSNNKKKLSGGAVAGIAIGSVLGFLLLVAILIFLCRKKSSSKKGSTVDIATVKHPEVEIPGEKSVREVENGGYGNGYSVAAAAAAAMTGTAKAETNGGGAGAKKLGVRFGGFVEGLSGGVGEGTFGTAYKAVLEMGTVVAVKRLKDVTITEKEFRDKIELWEQWIIRIWSLSGLIILAGTRSCLSMITWLWEAYLLSYMNVEEEMVQLLQLAVDCAAQYPDKRPSMSEATRRIEELCRSSLREDHDPQPDFINVAADDVSSR
ncbi:putative inactive receptor kinase [Quercus suber]|uniref:Inactive receptor kinase n=1 Tax=Quercus suber TaxID=58331 RepID=A0AAW0KFK4_QUESU